MRVLTNKQLTETRHTSEALRLLAAATRAGEASFFNLLHYGSSEIRHDPSEEIGSKKIPTAH
jgi:hypothetical protein